VDHAGGQGGSLPEHADFDAAGRGTCLAPRRATEITLNQAPTPPAAPQAAGTAAERETRLIAYLVFSAMILGAILQIWVPPGPLTLVAASGLASLVVLGVSLAVPGRLRGTLAGFRFTASLLIALAIFAIIGTLVLQGKPAAVYLRRYGAFGPIILALRFDDIFHGLPFAGLNALFGAAILSSASLRWPISAKRAGFFVAHVGLLVSGAGAAASSVLSVRGRIDMYAGGDVATSVRVEKGGKPTGEVAPLGFELKLDQFDLVTYQTEFRVGYYEEELSWRDGQLLQGVKLKTSFDPLTERRAMSDSGERPPDLARHRLPAGDSFRLKGVYPDFSQQTSAEPVAEGPPALQVTVGGETRWLVPGEAFTSPDGRVAVVFGLDRPAAPAGVGLVMLVSAKDRQVVTHSADFDKVDPITEGLSVPGGARLGKFLPSARRTEGYGTRSAEWRNPAVLLETNVGGVVKEELLLASQPRWIVLRPPGRPPARQGDPMAPPATALMFERREGEAKAYLSHVTAKKDGRTEPAVISVNDPFTFGGWTLYQVNYRAEEPTYSGLEAVRDPGVPFVFLGFTLICLGVAYMFYVEPRLRAGGIERPTAPPAAGTPS
jgi:hypothetical protein